MTKITQADIDRLATGVLGLDPVADYEEIQELDFNDLNTVFMLVEKMREAGWCVFLSNNCVNEGVGWACVLENPRQTTEWHKLTFPSFRVTADKPEQAICLAIKAVLDKTK